MEDKVKEVQNTALDALKKCLGEQAVQEWKVRFLGKKGELTALMKGMGKVPKEKRPEIGMLINEAKAAVDKAREEHLKYLAENRYDDIAEREWIDVTMPGEEPVRGHLHPISVVQRELEEIFSSMGFTVLDGPEVETEYNNFEALNIPADHPARDMQDTFWTEDLNLLRTHTSCIQVRGMSQLKPPFRLIAPGRVFRYEATDASHENTFWQMEGLMVDRSISVANLIHFMKSLLKEIFRENVRIRLRPGYFPFVEPGFELDIHCLICGGKGCSVCGNSGWVELLPCGLVNPKVLSFARIDPEIFSGFAFGLGLNRLVMMRYGIDDIRHFLSGDLRFVRQF